MSSDLPTEVLEERGPTPARWLWVAVPALLPLAAVPWRSDGSLAVGMLTIAAVACVAAAEGRAIGLLAGLAGAVTFDLLIVDPYGSLTVAKRDDLLAIITMSVIGLLVGHLSERAAIEREHRVVVESELLELHLLLELAAAGEPPGRLIVVAERALRMATGLPCRYESIPFLDNLPEVHHTSIQVPPGDPGLLATRNLVQVPVRSEGVLFGRFVIELDTPGPVSVLSQDWRPRAIAVADRLGQALRGLPR